MKITILACFTMLLAGISCPITNHVHGKVIPLDSFLRSIHWGHASDGILRYSYNKKKFPVVFCGPIFCVSRNFWEDSDWMAVPLQRGSLIRDIPSIGDSGWLAAFALLVPASLPLSSWHCLSQQPDWALSWLGTYAHVPWNRSWSVRGPNSAASSTLGSFWGISRHQWAACSNDANVALVVLWRLCTWPRRIGLLTGKNHSFSNPQ